MEAISFLPFIGGLVPFAIAFFFAGKKGLKERSQQYFFLAFLSLAVFGFSETLSYITQDSETAFFFLKLGKTSGLVFAFSILSFSAYLKGDNKLDIYFGILTVVLIVYGWLTLYVSVYPTSWGWAYEYNRIPYLIIYSAVIVYLVIGIWILFSVLLEMRRDKNPKYGKMSWVAGGFFLWALLAISTNFVVILFKLDIMPPLAFLQLIPCGMAAYGVLGNGVKTKADGSAV